MIQIKNNQLKEFLLQHPDRIPIIIHRSKHCKTIPEINKTNFIVSSDLLVANFIYIIRKRLKLTPDMAIFIYINNTIPSTTVTVGSLYEEYKNQDGILYLEYTSENAFGNSHFSENTF